jgi:hypothetical protein
LKDDQPAASGTTWEFFITTLLSVFALIANRTREGLALGADNDGCAEAHFTLISYIPRERASASVRI